MGCVMEGMDLLAAMPGGGTFPLSDWFSTTRRKISFSELLHTSFCETGLLCSINYVYIICVIEQSLSFICVTFEIKRLSARSYNSK
jgi:hypothetical protein